MSPTLSQRLPPSSSARYYNEQYGTSFLSVMPTNLYGPNDNFDPVSSHVVPALIRKMHDAKMRSEQVILWGDGTPRREFLYVDDFARAAVFLMERCEASQVGEFINIGTGTDMTIKELAETVAEAVGYKGRIEWDLTKPNGTPRKLLDITTNSRSGVEADDGVQSRLGANVPVVSRERTRMTARTAAEQSREGRSVHCPALLRTFGFDPGRTIRSIIALPRYFRELRQFRSQSRAANSPFPLGKLYPCLGERGAITAAGHYFHQDLHVAQKIFEDRPRCMST